MNHREELGTPHLCWAIMPKEVPVETMGEEVLADMEVLAAPVAEVVTVEMVVPVAVMEHREIVVLVVVDREAL